MHLAQDLDIDPEELEMNTSLQEALLCTTCTPPPKSTLYNSLTTGTYNPSNDPPFAHPNTEISISPFDTPTPSPQPGYSKATSSQRDLYLRLIAAEVGDEDDDEEWLFAKYKIDFHIHQHYLAGRGMLTLCRDVEEMHELRRWRWKMDVIDGWEGVSVSRRWGWPRDGNREMSYQTSLWRRKWRARQRRVEEVRIRWMGIVEERRRERERQRQRQRRIRKVRLYWRDGGKGVVRELEVDNE